MTRILFYYPSNKRSVSLETLILELHRRGAPIEVLTTCEAGPFHDYLTAQGIPTHTHPLPKRNALVYYLRQAWFLAAFCRRGGFTVVFSNLQHANFIAVFAQFLTSARVVAFRHHFKFTLPGDGIPLVPNRMERVFDWVINRLAREIVVPSSGVYNGMAVVERADMSRVEILPYVYDFAQYGEPDAENVEAIKAEYPARLRVLMISRLIPYKRHALVFPVIKALVDEGYDVRMFVLDEGPERDSLVGYIREHGLEDRIEMLGFRSDFLDFMAASDIMVHPSLTEASSNSMKELGLLGGTAIVCRGVGDFDEYLVHGDNAYFVPRNTDGREIGELLRAVYADPSIVRRMGSRLRHTVLQRFSVGSAVMDDYLAIARLEPGARRRARPTAASAGLSADSLEPDRPTGYT